MYDSAQWNQVQLPLLLSTVEEQGPLLLLWVLVIAQQCIVRQSCMREEAIGTYVFFSCWSKNQMYTHEVQHRRDENHEWWLEATWEVVEACVYR